MELLPEKVFLMSLMSLCHKPFVYKGWASDIKWHYRGKSDIKLQIIPVFGDFSPNMHYMYRHFFIYDGLYLSLCALYFAICLVFISKPNCNNSGHCHQSILVVLLIIIRLPASSNILFHVRQFNYLTCVIELFTLCNTITHVV